MDRAEATEILTEAVLLARSRPYEDLRGLINDEEINEVVGDSGVAYQVETQVFWDSLPNGNLRVMVSIDDGGFRAFVPLTEDFILASDGTLVGE